ncbi:MAG: zinc ribbon domain-containing protein [Saprospiraceae bacterium]
MKANKHCQSCGMPMKKDNMGGGSNADGTISKVYCSKCYEQGAFKEPNISMLEMQIKVRDKISSVGIPGIVAGLFTSRIPNLERWKKQST